MHIAFKLVQLRQVLLKRSLFQYFKGFFVIKLFNWRGMVIMDSTYTLHQDTRMITSLIAFKVFAFPIDEVILIVISIVP